MGRSPQHFGRDITLGAVKRRMWLRRVRGLFGVGRGLASARWLVGGAESSRRGGLAAALSNILPHGWRRETWCRGAWRGSGEFLGAALTGCDASTLRVLGAKLLYSAASLASRGRHGSSCRARSGCACAQHHLRPESGIFGTPVATSWRVCRCGSHSAFSATFLTRWWRHGVAASCFQQRIALVGVVRRWEWGPYGGASSSRSAAVAAHPSHHDGLLLSAALVNAGVALREGARELMMSMAAHSSAHRHHTLTTSTATQRPRLVAEDSEAGFTSLLTKRGALEAAGINIIIHRVAPAGHTFCADALAIM
jgi:hypothetical protein